MTTKRLATIVSEKEVKEIICKFPLVCNICSSIIGWTNRTDQQTLCQNCQVVIVKRRRKLLSEIREI